MVAQGAVAERMPCAFVTHGGGPMPVIAPDKQGGLSQSLRELGERVRKLKPKAVLVVSAHWEESKVSIIPDEKPELLYDYYGFPPESYELKYPAPGHPELARSVSQLLMSKGIPTESVSGRGWDHGVFIPLMLMLSEADIPVLQLSLLKSLDPTAHLKLGEALSSLRDEGVFILGSGSSFHNMGGFFGRGDYRGASKAFHAWLKDTLCTSTPEKRWAALEAWQSAPHAVDCHPREEHLIPLHVAVGAAGSDAGQLAYLGDMMNVEVASYWFGRLP